MKATRFFLDTAYVLVLLNPNDIYHQQAMAMLPAIDQDLKDALTTDEHFQQAGFKAMFLLD